MEEKPGQLCNFAVSTANISFPVMIGSGPYGFVGALIL